MAGMRRSEVSARRWADVADAADGDGVLVTVRRSKTNQEGEVRDVRFVKGGVARAIRTLRAAANPAPAVRVVPLSPKMVEAAVPGGGAGRRRRARDRPLGKGRAGVGAHEPGSVEQAQSNEDLVRRFIEACLRTRTILPATTTIERLCAASTLGLSSSTATAVAAGVLPGPPRRRAEPGRGCARDSGAWFPANECRVGTASRRPCSPPCP